MSSVLSLALALGHLISVHVCRPCILVNQDPRGQTPLLSLLLSAIPSLYLLSSSPSCLHPQLGWSTIMDQFPSIPIHSSSVRSWAGEGTDVCSSYWSGASAFSLPSELRSKGSHSFPACMAATVMSSWCPCSPGFLSLHLPLLQ